MLILIGVILVNARIEKKIFACDFETTVYENQTRTDVWASCLCELNTEEPILFGCIEDTYEYFESLNCNIDAYYHNLKFDGNFWLYYFLHDRQMEQAFTYTDKEHGMVEFLPDKEMKRNTFKYLISKMGQWYTITVRLNNGCYLRFKDSLKLFPFKLSEIAKGFKTKHQKLTMEYEGFRYPNCPISPQEKEYICNDVFVLKEALELFFTDNPQNKITIGSCCLAEFKKSFIFFDEFEKWFPNLKDIDLDPTIHKYSNIEAWCRKSYRGGWCYVVPEKADQIKTNGVTADVNSLYPSMMSSESGNEYPYGKPQFWSGNYIPDEATKPHRFYFVRIKTRFYIKPNHLPFVQIKGDLRYRGNDVLESSDYYDRKTDKYYDHYYENGELHDTRVELTMTQTDFALLQDHYDLVDFEILDGCYFLATDGLFDEYIEKYKKQKLESKGAKRTEAKLFLNNLYGKFATSDDSTFKVAYLCEVDNCVKFYDCIEHNKPILYIPIGSAITSYARNFTIRTAQKNYYGKNKRGFIYADTDSIHCDLKPEELIGVPVHPNNFCHWKLESYWDKGIFARQKTYIEHVTHEDGEPVEPYYNIKCAGMPMSCKELLNESLNHVTEEDIERLEIKRKKPFTDEEKRFMLQPRELTDFKIGLTVPSKLMPKRISGGVLLVSTTFKMQPVL